MWYIQYWLSVLVFFMKPNTWPRTAAVIPAYNEQQHHLASVVERTARFVDEVFVVDDGSDARFLSLYRQLASHARVLRHRINLGKGAALRTGAQAAITSGAQIVVFLDADGQHDPEDIPRLVKKLINDKLDIVFGSRQIGRDMPLMMMLGNKFFSIATSLLFGIYLSDTQSGFRAFRSAIYPKLAWRSPRYAVEIEIVVNAGKHKLRFGEVDVQTIYHDKYKGTTVFDGIRIFINMLVWRFT